MTTRFRFSVLTSFPRLGGRAEAIAKIAAMGFDGIEMDTPTPDEDLGAIVRTLNEARIPAVCIGAVGNTGRALMRPERTLDDVRQAFAPSARLAKLSGAERMQYCCLESPQSGEAVDEFRDRLIDRLSVAADVAAAEGVTVVFEPLAPDSSAVAVSTAEGCEILARVNKPAIGMTFDTYHSAAAGEDPIESLHLALPWLRHVHLSDIRHTPQGLRRPLPGKGEIDFSRFLRALADSGYGGYVGMEGQFASDDYVGELAECLAYVRRL